ncbi:class I SAM-dependent methyltransferase [Clostridium beijerinckii]|uniref:class I SAM-dependent methyltransferase n=1 Tax=Clostridium beijerinckii TaxID=1520 RepID=UPI0030FE18C5
MDSLEIKEGNYIMDIGSGGGYFSYKFSKSVGQFGKIYAIDVDQRNLNFIMKKAKKNRISNIETCMVAEDELHIQSGKVDIVFLRDVFHDIRNKLYYFKSMANILNKDGKVAIIDFINDGISRESITGHCSDEGEIISIMEKCGYMHYKQFHYLDKQSYNIFKLQSQ